MTKLVILDRDGVINFDSADFIKTPEEWLAIPGSLQAIANLNKAGFKVAIATNQSGIGRGLYTLQTLDHIHQKMNVELAKVGGHIACLLFCPHTPDAGCLCRKPLPGLLNNIAAQFNIDFSKSKIAAIGDSLRDLQAAQAAGCEPILVKTGNGKKTIQNLPPELQSTLIFEDLLAATTFIINRDSNTL